MQFGHELGGLPLFAESTADAATRTVARPRARPGKPPGLIARTSQRVIAVGGGKGGIGKTMVSANLAIALAQQGKRVVVMDADLGGANLHTCLGLPPPDRSLSQFVNRRVTALSELMVPAGVPNLWLIAGAHDVLDAANPKHHQKARVIRQVQTLNVDYVVLDLGAGTSFNVLDFFLIADHGVIVLLPEPTSIENAYRFIKAAFFRGLQSADEFKPIADCLGPALGGTGGARTPMELIARVRPHHPEVAQWLERQLSRFSARLVVNQVRTPADREVGQAVVAAWRKFFGLDMKYLGAVGYDDEVWQAVRRRRPLLLERPRSTVGLALTELAQRLLELDAAPARS